jgi:hypothetical protein
MAWSSVFMLGFYLGSASLSQAALDGTRYLWFDKPGDDWETSAQLIGCGRLGASIYGSGNEIITLTEDSIWDGPLQNRIPPDGLAHEPQVRQDLLDGNYTEGGNLCLEYMTPEAPWERGFSYFGSLHLDIGHPDNTENYIRWLDTRQGNMEVSYTYEGVNYT